MALCCLLVIIVIIVIGILIIYILFKVYTSIKVFLKSKQVHDADKITASATIENIDNNNNNNNTVNDNIYDNDILMISLYAGEPCIRSCMTSHQCSFMRFCNIKVCKHLVNIINIQYDKNTMHNVTYITLPNCLIVFQTKSDKFCTKEQDEGILEDNNYINAYTSKFLDTPIYSVYYDHEDKYFKDDKGKKYTDYIINCKYLQPQQMQILPSPSSPPSTQNLLQTNDIVKIPTAPYENYTHNNNNNIKGSLFYISKR